ncbi:BlaI/MecI/CopY family transcriptional regulator [Paenibacillus filicis]|uniref:BlaI/MecI/CopY family transcriptional regulator n=1 Tax=Paenibacillus filicis TaxID=669464 RepID=A0ABU9DCJ2_9BACL
MHPSIAKITDSELEVLRILWEAGRELPMAEIRASLERSSRWDSSTIKTLLRRLCEKGAVLAEKQDVFYYKPLVSEKEYNDYTTQSLIDRLYAGSAKSLVASLLGGNKLNDADLAELRMLLKEEDKDA